MDLPSDLGLHGIPVRNSGSGTTNPEFVIQNSGFVVPDPEFKL
jgi:hypothetical protein